MAQDGSLASTPSKACFAVEKEKECSSATARSIAGATSALQEVWKWTRPSFSCAGAGCSCGGRCAARSARPGTTTRRRLSFVFNAEDAEHRDVSRWHVDAPGGLRGRVAGRRVANCVVAFCSLQCNRVE